MTAALPGVLLMLLCLLQSAYGLANLGPGVTDPANFLPRRILVRAKTTTVVGTHRAQTLDRQATASALPEWLSREPLGESESVNLYAYCHNDPVNNVDVLGLAPAGLNPEQSKIFDELLAKWPIRERLDAGVTAKILGIMRMDGYLDDSRLEQAARLDAYETQVGDVYRKNPVLINTVSGIADAAMHMIPGSGPQGAGAADGSNTTFMLAVDTFRLFGGSLIALDPGSPRSFRNEVFPGFVKGYNAKYSYQQRTGAEIGTLLAAFIAPELKLQVGEAFSGLKGSRLGEVLNPSFAGRPGFAPGRVINPFSKWVPNPGGKLGDALTRQTAANVITDLGARGFTDISQEVLFQKGPLGLKNRFADIVGLNPQTGESLIINIGKQTKSGIPIIRERKALDDFIFSPTIQDYTNSRLLFIEKGASGLPPGF